MSQKLFRYLSQDVWHQVIFNLLNHDSNTITHTKNYRLVCKDFLDLISKAIIITIKSESNYIESGIITLFPNINTINMVHNSFDVIPRFIGPLKIIKKVNEPAFQLDLPPELKGIHSTFHVCYLRKCNANEEDVIPIIHSMCDS